MVVKRHALAALPPGTKTRYPLFRRLGAPQGRSGRVRKISTPGFDPQPVQPVASRYTDRAISVLFSLYSFFFYDSVRVYGPLSRCGNPIAANIISYHMMPCKHMKTHTEVTKLRKYADISGSGANFSSLWAWQIRTVHNEHDPLADCGRDAVRCYAQVRPHMQAVDPGDVENRSFHTSHWNQE